MNETLLVVAATIIVGLLGVLGVGVTQLSTRVERLEGYNHRLWAYTRYLLDLYYRHRSPDAPDPAPLPDDD